jgi:hypothetical protein
VTALALAWLSTLAAGAAYFGPIVGTMITLAVGFSLVNAPSVAATMDTLEPDQIGAGAAGNETTRELGGTMGVAIIGSVFASLFGPAIRRAFEPFRALGLTSHQVSIAQSSMEAAKMTAMHLPVSAQTTLAPQLTAAFMNGFHRGCLVAAATAAVVAVIVFWYLPAGKMTPETESVCEH